MSELEESPSQAATAGLEARIASMDARIATIDQQLADADQAVSEAAAVPGAVIEVPPRAARSQSTFPEELIAVPIVFTIFVLFPLSIAWSRRLWKKGATVIAPVPSEVRERLDQLGQAVDAVALEVERIGEGQRFITRVMSESPRALGEGAVPHIPVARPAERESVQRGDQADWR